MSELRQKGRVGEPVGEVDVPGHLGPGVVDHVHVEQQVVVLLRLLAHPLQPWKQHLAEVTTAMIYCAFLRPHRLFGLVELLVCKEWALWVETPKELESVIGSINSILPSLTLLQLGVEVVFVGGEHVELNVGLLGLRDLWGGQSLRMVI